MLQVPGLYIGLSEGRGRGVYTAGELNPGDVIEICPLIIIPASEVRNLDQTVLFNYYFLWNEPTGGACLPGGLGCFYNHSSNPNADAEMDIANESLNFICNKNIKPGDEVFIDYTNAGKGKLWFDPI